MRPNPALAAFVFAVPFALLGAAPGHGQLVGTFGPVTIEASRTPTPQGAGLPQLPGHSTWTLSASSDLGVRAFDFVGNRNSQFGDADAYGFFGPMNQITAAGMPTIFNDSGFEFPHHSDSYFLVRSSQVVVPAGVSSESSTHLRSAFASSNPLPSPAPFVQLVRSDASPEPIQFRGIVVVGPLDNLQEILIFGTIPVPEPASALLPISAVACIYCVFSRRSRF